MTQSCDGPAGRRMRRQDPLFPYHLLRSRPRPRRRLRHHRPFPTTRRLRRRPRPTLPRMHRLRPRRLPPRWLLPHRCRTRRRRRFPHLDRRLPQVHLFQRRGVPGEVNFLPGGRRTVTRSRTIMIPGLLAASLKAIARAVWRTWFLRRLRAILAWQGGVSVASAVAIGAAIDTERRLTACSPTSNGFREETERTFCGHRLNKQR
jgi:hypothetical protein